MGTSKIADIAVGLLVAGALMPVAIEFIANATITDPTVNTVFTVVLPILAVIGAALYFLPHGK